MYLTKVQSQRWVSQNSSGAQPLVALKCPHETISFPRNTTLLILRYLMSLYCIIMSVLDQSKGFEFKDSVHSLFLLSANGKMFV
jgi:hypothetical protein